MKDERARVLVDSAFRCGEGLPERMATLPPKRLPLGNPAGHLCDVIRESRGWAMRLVRHLMMRFQLWRIRRRIQSGLAKMRAPER